jgi:hypothetical protein
LKSLLGYGSLAGGCPAASHFLLRRQKKVTKEKATPLIPETPEIEPAGWAAKNSFFFCCFDFIFVRRTSDTFAADPPDRLDYRRG